MLNLVFDGWWVAGILWKNGYIVGFVLSNGLCLRGFVGGFYLGENGGGVGFLILRIRGCLRINSLI